MMKKEETSSSTTLTKFLDSKVVDVARWREQRWSFKQR